MGFGDLGGPPSLFSGLPNQYYPQGVLHSEVQPHTTAPSHAPSEDTLQWQRSNWIHSGEDLFGVYQDTGLVPGHGWSKAGDRILHISEEYSRDFTTLPNISQDDTLDPLSLSASNAYSVENGSPLDRSPHPIEDISPNETIPESPIVPQKTSRSPKDSYAAVSCSNCTTRATSLWRRDSEGLPVCNACGLFVKLHGVSRPLSLKTDVIKKRRRTSCVNLLSRERKGHTTRNGTRRTASIS